MIPGTLTCSMSKDGTTHESEWYVPAADVSNFMTANDVGMKATWAVPIGGHSPVLVKSVELRRIGGGAADDGTPMPYRARIVAEPKEKKNTSGGGSVGVDEADKPSDADTFSVTTTEIHMKPEWWGCVKATKEEAGWDADAKAYVDADKFHNVKDEDCKQGEWRFASAGRGTAGEAYHAMSPFTDASCTAAAMPVGQIDQKVKSSIYVAKFYLNAHPSEVKAFRGVSGTIPEHMAPPDVGDGLWRAVSQELRLVKNKKGQTWTEVTRKAELAPNASDGLRWDPDKNGGTWEWEK
jgi:hypothetical protein